MWNEAQRSERLFWESITKAEWEKMKKQEKVKVIRAALKIKEAIKNIGVESCKRVLDVGCGPTVLSRYLDSTEKVGVDPLINSFSKAFVLPKSKYDYVQCLAEALPFRNDSFDLILCRNVLDHTIRPKAVMQNLEKILENGAYLALSVNVFPPVTAALEKIMRIIFEKHWDPFHPHVFTASEIKRICLSHNLTVVYETCIRENLPHVGDVTYGSTPKFETEFQRELQRAEALMEGQIRLNSRKDYELYRNDKLLGYLKFFVSTLCRYIDKFMFNANWIFREYLIVATRER